MVIYTRTTITVLTGPSRWTVTPITSGSVRTRYLGLPVWQNCPVHPARQVQIKDPTKSWQTPPFWQGPEIHSFTSVKKINMKHKYSWVRSIHSDTDTGRIPRCSYNYRWCRGCWYIHWCLKQEYRCRSCFPSIPGYTGSVNQWTHLYMNTGRTRLCSHKVHRSDRGK